MFKEIETTKLDCTFYAKMFTVRKDRLNISTDRFISSSVEVKFFGFN